MTREANPKLTHAPLMLTLCQVRFSTLRTMRDHIPAIQQRLRETMGLRVDASEKVQELILGPAGQQPVIQTVDRWEFTDLERSKSVIITEQFMVYQTVAYTVFDDFRADLLRAMQAIAATGQDIIVTRVGLRYLDAIQPAAGKTWQQYLANSLHGPQAPEVFAQEPLMAYHQIGKTQQGLLVARISQNTEGNPLPPELAQGIKLTITALPKTAITTIIDIDHYREGDLQQEYNDDWLEDLVWKLKDDIYTAFRSYVSSEAMEEWA